MIKHEAVLLAARGRLLTTPGLPTARAWLGQPFTPTTGQPFIRERYLPGGTVLRSFPAAGGTLEATPLYQIDTFVPTAAGATLAGLVDAILAHLRPGTPLPHGALPAGTTVTVRGNPAPTAGPVLTAAEFPGWLLQPITIPLTAYAANT